MRFVKSGVPRRRTQASGERARSVLVFSREVRRNIARGAFSDCRSRQRRVGGIGRAASGSLRRGCTGGAGLGGAFCRGGSGFAGWGTGQGGGGVPESLGGGSTGGGCLCEFGSDCDAAAAVGAGVGIVAESRAAGAECCGDTFKCWIGLLPAE